MLKYKKVLITGGSGLLALNWACVIRNNFDVVLGTHTQNVDMSGVHVANISLDSAESFSLDLDYFKPDIVVHTAGLTNVDQCEKIPELAYHSNVKIAENVARETVKRNIPLVHISTDHLFSGENCLYIEDDLICPLNEYAKTKGCAERIVSSIHPKALILRTNFFCWGHQYRQSFTDWLIYNMQSGNALTVFDDVFFTPILADRLVLIAHELLEKGHSGIYNIVGEQRLSKYQFAMDVCNEFDFDLSLIRAGKLKEASMLTTRPYDMSLDNSKVRKILGYNVGHVKNFLLMLKEQDRLGRREELLGAIYQ